MSDHIIYIGPTRKKGIVYTCKISCHKKDQPNTVSETYVHGASIEEVEKKKEYVIEKLKSTW